MAKITIVTPVYNGARYLADTIKSVQVQSFRDWEYVIVDGGSSDATLSIAHTLCQSDDRIRIVSEPDRGMYDAVMKGFAMTTAPICCWLNADDMLMPWAFGVVATYMNDGTLQWITALPSLWDTEGRLFSVGLPLWKPRALLRLGLHHTNGMGWIQQESTFFSRRLLLSVAPERLEAIRQSKLAGDALLWREFAATAELWPIGTVVSGFRVHSANASLAIDAYFKELRAGGATVPPRLVALFFRMFFLPLSLLIGRLTSMRLQKRYMGGRQS
jgi:Glycosyl transferase family 2